MTSFELRLELLKLVHRHDHTSEDAIQRARELEAYVITRAAGQAQAPASSRGKTKPADKA